MTPHEKDPLISCLAELAGELDKENISVVLGGGMSQYLRGKISGARPPRYPFAAPRTSPPPPLRACCACGTTNPISGSAHYTTAILSRSSRTSPNFSGHESAAKIRPIGISATPLSY